MEQYIGPTDIKKLTSSYTITYYTDPLCCWSWAFEPVWKEVQHALKGRAAIRYCMSGMLESWNSYHDTEHAISKPVQMGPLWMQAAHLTGAKLDGVIWIKDPPASSYMACVAVKVVFLQSPEWGVLYLKMLWEAVMTRQINIAGQNALTQIASELYRQVSGFDLCRFENDLVNGNGYRAFAQDLQEVRYFGVQRLPALSIVAESGRGVMLTGYRSYESILSAIASLAT